jgi:N-glycosidase YbiA
MSIDVINNFTGQYRFLSNFWPAEVYFDGEEYPSVEYAYQAAKTFDNAERKLIREISTPGKAKGRGKKISLRPDWEQVKLGIMEDLVYQKFHRHPDLRRALLNTGVAYLEEGNTWGDIVYGVCNGVGENHLGLILMKVRAKLRGREQCQ